MIDLCRLWTERFDGSSADGWQITIQLFGIVLSFGIAR